MQVYKYEEITKDLGVGQNKNMLSDGEFFIIQNFIKKGDVVIDVGAFRGEWSLLVLSHVCPKMIYLFEPIKNSAQRLWQSFFFRTNIMFMANGTGETTEKGKLKWYNGNDVFSELSTRYDRLELEEKLKLYATIVDADFLKLDEFLNINDIEHVNFIKIDNEGDEVPTMKGMKDYLQNQDIDFIQFDFCDAWKGSGCKFKDAFDLLTMNGYKLFRMLPDALLDISEYEECMEEKLYCNYLAISSKKYEELANG